MDDERCCNTCEHYDPVEGWCGKYDVYHHGYDGKDCDSWRDWEGQYVRPFASTARKRGQ